MYPRLLVFLVLSWAAPMVAAQSSHVYFTQQSFGAIQNLIASQRAVHRELVNIERKVHAGLVRYDAVFAPLPQGQVHAMIDATVSEYDDFLTYARSLDGRLIDVEVDDSGGSWRFSALFWESGEQDVTWEVRTRRSRAEFQVLLEQHARGSAALVDIEVGLQSGVLRYGGVWQSHPGQPRTVLYHDLAAQELGGILDSTSARLTAGRVVDIERYHDPDIGADRFAVLVALAPGDGERYSRGINLPSLTNEHASTANAGTHLVDIERYDDSNGDLRVDALWGPGRAALLDVAPIRRDDLAMFRGADLDTEIGRIDAGVTRSNVLGVFGLNLRTRQSVSWRGDESFPLASVVKVPIHYRLYRDVGLELVDPVASQEAFTDCAGCSNPFAPHWVDNRAAPGLGCADRGTSLSLERFAQGMMKVSDNAATNVLLLRQGGLARQTNSLNEWLAGLDGIGQGFGPIVSIGELDRIAAWRGQWTSGCAAPTGLANSFLRAPTAAIEVYQRDSNSKDVCDGLPADRFLDAHFAPNPVPVLCEDAGLRQFHDMGLNSATPRAMVLLHEALQAGQLVAPAAMSELLAAMANGGPLDNAPGFPGEDEHYAKAGRKGVVGALDSTHVVTDTALMRIGKDWYALAVFGKHLSVADTTLRTWSAVNGNYPAVAYAMLKRIAPDLRRAATAPQWTGPTTLQAGDAVQLQLRVRNAGGGHASGFRVALHLSTDTTISATDPLLGTVDASELGNGLERTLTLAGTLPAGIADGSYYVGWRIDVPIAAQPETVINGQVGEWDESAASNSGHVDGLQVVVLNTPHIFENGFE
jgi:hypothetical protein